MSLESAIENLALAMTRLASSIDQAAHRASVNPWPAMIGAGVSAAHGPSLVESITAAAKAKLEDTQELPPVTESAPVSNINDPPKRRGRPPKSRAKPEEIDRVDLTPVTQAVEAHPHEADQAADIQPVEETPDAESDEAQPKLLSEVDPELYDQLTVVVTRLCERGGQVGYNEAKKILASQGLTSGKDATVSQYMPLMAAFKKALTGLDAKGT
jgi:hypothetical protein